MYVRKEAVLSSMIEGTQSSLSDLLLFELDQEPGVPLNDVQEVSNYVAVGQLPILTTFSVALTPFNKLKSVPVFSSDY